MSGGETDARTLDKRLELRPIELPTSVTVVGQRYVVQVVEDQHEALARVQNDGHMLGVTELVRGVIRLRGGAEQSADSMRDTLLHEVLHAVDYLANGGLENQLDEATIARLATVLLSTLRANPDLVDALLAR